MGSAPYWQLLFLLLGHIQNSLRNVILLQERVSLKIYLTESHTSQSHKSLLTEEKGHFRKVYKVVARILNYRR